MDDALADADMHPTDLLSQNVDRNRPLPSKRSSVGDHGSLLLLVQKLCFQRLFHQTILANEDGLKSEACRLAWKMLEF